VHGGQDSCGRRECGPYSMVCPERAATESGDVLLNLNPRLCREIVQEVAAEESVGHTAWSALTELQQNQVVRFKGLITGNCCNGDFSSRAALVF